MPPESRSVDRCAELREQCQQRIFARMDEQHTEVMDTLADIRVKLAERAGRDSAAETPAARRWSWREVTAVIVIASGVIAAAVAAVWKGSQ